MNREINAHIEGKKKKSLLHYVHNTTLQFTNFIISQLPINFKVSNKLNFYFKKKTLIDKHNYLPLKETAIHISTKRQNSTHRAQHMGGYQSTSSHFYYF